MEREVLINRVIEWSNINSNSFNLPGLEKMAAVLRQAFSVLECESEQLSLPAIEHIDALGLKKSIAVGPMLRFWKRREAPVQVLLVGHMDTVFEVDHHFQHAVRKADHLHGPGVADMKGGICVMLEALKLFEKNSKASQLGWEVLINPDEEIGSFASAPFLEERAKAHQVGLLFEPAMDEQGTLAGSRKGSANFVLVAHGRAAHAGRDFAAGRNAIALLADVISAIDALNGKREGVTLNVGQAQGGGSVNVVPAFAICRLDVRILKMDDQAWVQEQLDSIVAKLNQREGYKVELLGGFNRRPKEVSGKTERLYKLVREIGEELGQVIAWKPSGGCCDGNNLSAAGLPNVDTLGVCGGGIHSDQEYLLVDSLISRAKLTEALLSRLSEGNFK